MQTMDLKPVISPTCVTSTAELAKSHRHHWHLLTALEQILSLLGSGDCDFAGKFAGCSDHWTILPLHVAEVPSFCVSPWTPWELDVLFLKDLLARTCFVFSKP